MSKNLQRQLYKTLKITLNVLFYLFIVLLLVFSIANIKVKDNADIPNIFGVGFLSVASDSMDGNQPNSFQTGDLIFVDILDDEDKNQLKVGDIITFYDDDLRALNTHRIVEIDGNFIFTQGDKVALDPERKYDPNVNNNDETAYEVITKTKALAVYKSTWNGAGKTLSKLQTPAGFALFVILPATIALGVEGYFLVKNILNINKAKLEEKHAQDKEEAKKELEKQKELIRAQLLEEMKKEQDNNKQ